MKFFRSHVICNLDIVSLVSLIHHKVNLQLLANTLALFILIEEIHDTHRNGVRPLSVSGRQLSFGEQHHELTAGSDPLCDILQQLEETVSGSAIEGFCDLLPVRRPGEFQLTVGAVEKLRVR